MRRAPAFRKVHAASDRVEPRMAKAVALAADRIRERLPYDAVEEALSRRDARTALALLDAVDFADAYRPSAEILREALVKGGKVGDA